MSTSHNGNKLRVHPKFILNTLGKKSRKSKFSYRHNILLKNIHRLILMSYNSVCFKHRVNK